MTGDEFKKKRIALGYKKRVAIADEIGVEVPTVKSWEIGARPVPRYAERALNRIQPISKSSRG